MQAFPSSFCSSFHNANKWCHEAEKVDLAQVLGWIATFLFSVMIIPQMIKTIKMKDTRGVSLLFFVIFLVANTIALLYALLISQPPLVIKYIIAMITTGVYIGLYWRYFKKEKKRVARLKK